MQGCFATRSPLAGTTASPRHSRASPATSLVRSPVALARIPRSIARQYSNSASIVPPLRATVKRSPRFGYPPTCCAGAVSVEAAPGSGAEMQVQLLVHYSRDGGDYLGWGLHVWGDVSTPTPWDRPVMGQPGWQDAGENVTGNSGEGFGVQYSVPCKATRDSKTGKWAATVNMLPHRGEDKDCTWTLTWEADSADVEKGAPVGVWLVQGRASSLFLSRPDLLALPRGSLDTARALWLGRHVIAVPPAWADVGRGSEASFELYSSNVASLSLSAAKVEGADTSFPLSLDPSGLPEEIKAKFPHVRDYVALRLPSDAPVETLVKSRVAVSCSAGGRMMDSTEAQITGVLDDCFTYDGPLGVNVEGSDVSITLWAPTAQSVELLLFDQPHASPPVKSIKLEQGEKGQWSATGRADEWLGLYYQYKLAVYHPQTRTVERCTATDPYSRGLSANGERSLVVDLVNPEAVKLLQAKGEVVSPPGWESLHAEKPALDDFADVSLYELHVRDFSAADETVEASKRGTYLAFTEPDSNGVKHLRGLAEAGLSHVHLLPTYDFASVNEDKATWQSVDESALRALPPDSDQQQAAVTKIQDVDAFNWGYDPAHWGTPDGSYATNPDGVVRTYEYRSMVQALNRTGLRVVVDVVYNHLHASGPHDQYSILDKVVPGYYLRRNVEGVVEGSTCCNNTASEHAMCERLIVDDMINWVKVYKIDGFRFDLMGHIMKKTLTRARDALDSLTVEKDGVDGAKVYMYGEGWDFGEVARNGRGENGGQMNLAHSSIGSFNDRFRDAMLGGSPFGDPQQQGFLTGLLLQPNAWETAQAQAQGRSDSDSETEWGRQLAWQTDTLQFGLAGNLRDFRFKSLASGGVVRAGDLNTHDGVSLAYAGQPFETVNYISAHDNETLFDVIQLKASKEASGKDRFAMCKLGVAMLALTQGVPFFHAGDEMLRSKSLDRDSYNSGDWFNRLDFSYETNNFAVGLPIFGKNGEKWDLMRSLLSDSTLRPTKEDILASVEHFKRFLKIRYSSPLFRLRTAEQVQQRVSFLSPAADISVPAGVIVTQIVDGEEGTGVEVLDGNWRRILVVSSVRPDESAVKVPSLGGVSLVHHPMLEEGAGGGGLLGFSATGELTVPARSILVFVEKR